MRMAAPAPAPEAPVPVTKTEAVLPLKTDKPVAATPRSKPSKVLPTPTGPTSAVAPESVHEFVSTQDLPTLSQPPLAPPKPLAAQAELPMLGPQAPSLGLPGAGEDKPPVPSDIPEFKSTLAQFEKPGEGVLVLALLVNDVGIVVDSAIVVPSKFALSDLTVTFSYLGKAWTDINPPMVPGEYRWFELRIDQLLALRRDAVLP